MTRVLLPLAASAALVLGASGCATDPNQVASARSHECKAVVVSRASDEIRYQARQGRPNNAVEQADAIGGLDRAELRQPRSLRAPPGSGLLFDAERDC